ncbi:MAG: acylphosphatase [Planctomycetota bacterium]|jgi:acylphosphatase
MQDLTPSDRGRGAARLVAHGRVQGVGYRWFVRGEARGLGLTGWVRNLRDGTVEVEAHGERASIEALVGRLQVGPSGSAVSDVDVGWLPRGSSAPGGFEILPTA